MPHMHLWRPCDTVETAVAWRAAIERRDGPTSLILTRQDLPHVQRTPDQIAAIARGGYICRTATREPAITLDRDGVRGAARRRRRGELGAVRRRGARRVDAVHASVRSRRTRTTATTCCRPAACGSSIEAGATGGWWRYAATAAASSASTSFGHSAPAKPLFEKFGFTVAAVAQAARILITDR